LETSCKICGSRVYKIFDAPILQKYITNYLQCNNCGFIQTEEPHWLPEAYVSAITAIDVGLIYRNIYFSDKLPSILDMFSNAQDSYLDYGGGHGMLVRIMRDKGYDFYLQDLYAENVYAKYFEFSDYKGREKFAAITTFEVFEHLVNPIEEISKMFHLSDTIIFSTELQPDINFKNYTDWWYFVPETGQHIAFYTKTSLNIISEKFKCNLYSDGVSLHILTKLNLPENPFLPINNQKTSFLQKLLIRIKKNPTNNEIKRFSYLQKDYELYKRNLFIRIK
jgi:hypothetical protein